MIHVQTWTGSGSARITDMTNAGQRGKKCRTFSFSGWAPFGGDERHQRCRDLNAQVYVYLEKISGTENFDTACAEVRRLIAAADLPPEWGVRTFDEEIRAIDAPKPKLTAGIHDLWSASADETGIHLHDLRDVNEWTEVTHDQTSARAYEIARKVWPQVRVAGTLHEASKVLRAAGARLHGYCALD